MPRLFHRIAAGISASAMAASAAIMMLTGSAQGQPLSIQTISAGQALKIVNAAIAKCSEPGPRITISVAVVDYAGNPRMLLNADTAAPHNLDLARRKAYTARTFRRLPRNGRKPQPSRRRNSVNGRWSTSFRSAAACRS